MSHSDNELFFATLGTIDSGLQNLPMVPLAEFEALQREVRVLQRRVRELERRVRLGDWAPPEELEVRMDGYRIITTDAPGGAAPKEEP
jgi:hypothetical protein